MFILRNAAAFALTGVLLLLNAWWGHAAPETDFVGRWDLTITAQGRELPSWLEIVHSPAATGGQRSEFSANFVGRWGSMRPLPKLELSGRDILFVSPKDEEGSQTDLVFRGKLTDAGLVGTAEGPNGTPWTWRGKRAPELKRPATQKWGNSVMLFDGKSFDGWNFDNPAKASSWRVERGCLVNRAAGSNIRTDASFQNFKLHIELKCPPKANSGIYLRGRYEVQVEDDSLEEPPTHHMGAVYGFLAPSPEQPRRPGMWQSFDITLQGRYVTVVQNGITIIDKKEIPGITGGAIDSHEESPGPIYLQGDHGGISYRNIILTPASP